MTKTSVSVIILFLLVYLLPLGVRPLVIPDEARYAEIPREMLASDDWIVPHLDGLRYFEKPVLGYWLNSIAMYLFGENSFAVRFPSAIAAGISALCLFFLVRKFTGKYFAGILAAVILLTFMQFFVEGTINTLDSVFSMFVTASLTVFFFAYAELNFRKKIFFLIMFGCLCGLAFLTKGFLAVALPAVVITPFAIWERRFKEVMKSIAVPIAAAIAVAMPWSITIYLKEHDFWNYFFWTEHIQRFLSHKAQHAKPFWYFVPLFIGGTMPWTVLLLATGKWLRRTGFKDSLIRFCTCWFVFCFLFFSASRGKLPTYIMPCFPPFAVIITLGLLQYVETQAKRDFSGGAWASSVIAAGFIVVLTVNQITGFPVARFFDRQELWKSGLVFAGAVSWGIFSVLAARSQDVRRKIVFFCLAPVLFMFSIPFVMPEKLKEGKAPEKFLLRHALQAQPTDILVSSNNMVHAVCWFYKRSDVYLLNDPDELEYGIGYPDSSHRLLTFEQFGELIKNTKNARVILIAREKGYTKLEAKIPTPTFKDVKEKFVFAEYQKY
jgi:4-amino-4-deoxy-L-arabinose transferase